MPLQRCGQSAATMLAVRAPQSKAPTVALSILSAPIKAMASTASADCWPVRGVSLARRAITAQVRDDHPIARRRQRRRHIDEAVNVVGPSVQEEDHRPICGAGFGVSDIQNAGIDLLERAEGGVRSWLDRRQPG